DAGVRRCAAALGGRIFGDGRALVVDGSSRRGNRCVLPHSSWNVGTPPRAFWPWTCVRLAPPGSTPQRPHRAQTVGCGGAQPAHAVAHLPSRCKPRPRARGSTMESDAHASRRTAVVPTPVL